MQTSEIACNFYTTGIRFVRIGEINISPLQLSFIAYCVVKWMMEELHLLGTRFHRINKDLLFRAIVERAGAKEKTVIANVNIRAMNLAFELSWYRDFLNQADLVFCDGFGVALGARLTGQKIRAEHRLTCPDWIEELAGICQRNDLSIFLLAGKPGVSDEAANRFKSAAPGLKIETHHGHFIKEGPENDRVIDRINTFKPDILLIGFGMPMQEQWINNNIDLVEASVFLPLGACLDFYTGKACRGPIWMTDHGLEWLSRLLAEPKRLGTRYLIGIPLFFWRVFKQTLKPN